MMSCLSPGLPAQTSDSGNAASVLHDFLVPPDDAKPMVRWWWFGAAVTRPEILRELQQMKADGIGGAELAFVYPEETDGVDPTNPAVTIRNLPFLSPGMLDAVHFAQGEGRRLGLRIDLTLCSGWPYGGPHTPLSQAAARLRFIAVPLPPGSTSVTVPVLKEGESFVSASVVRGDADKFDPASAKPFKLAPSGTSMALQPAAAAQTVLFFIQSHTGQQVKRAAVGAEGNVLDVFSREAVAKHLQSVGEPLLSAFGSTPPYAIFSDSLEAYGADWTPALPSEFLKRRGYDLLPHLPELVAGGTPGSANIRHDYGRTLKELVDENYLLQMNTWAKAHGTRFRSQTYGEPAVSFSSQSLVDLPEGEGSQWQSFSTLRWATSANHVFANNVTSGETYTWLHSPVFRATPLDMKAEADIDFVTGENQLIFHGWPYSPPPGARKPGDPGWSLYAAAVFNDHNPWHPVMPAITRYIARISYLLRQGQPANQVAILLPTDDAWAAYSPGNVSVSNAMRKLIRPELMAAILGAGYNVDFIDADAIDRVGMGTHQILLIPPTDRLPKQTLEKIKAYSSAGGKVFLVGRAPSLDAEGMPLGAVPFVSLVPAAQLVPGTDHLRDALHSAVAPDLAVLPSGQISQAALRSIGFIRRRLPGADIYFVANTSNQPLHFSATFATTHRYGEQIDPDIGTITGTNHAAGTPASHAEVQLAPYESRVFFFSDTKPPASRRLSGEAHVVADLSANWSLTFVDTGKTAPEEKLRDWTADSSTRNYSGEGIYTRDLRLATLPASPVYLRIDGGSAVPGSPDVMPQENVVRVRNGMPDPLVTSTGPGMRAWFDPPVREAALVVVNGHPAGAMWHPPYRLNLTGLLRVGMNHVEIHVYNTALNAWSALPPHDYGPLRAVYGDRFQMQDLDSVKPIPSGILGTIELVTQE